ncbi:MAG: magnesium transporter [Myxococcota bacterium]
METALSPQELREVWSLLDPAERVEGFQLIPVSEADDFFLTLTPREQSDLLLALPPTQRRTWVRLLPPDDAADMVQELPMEEREGVLALMDNVTRREVQALMAYAEDAAGGLMNPRFARVRPDMTVDEAISYLRKQTRERVEVIYYAYVLDAQQRLLGVVSFRDLFQAQPRMLVREVMHTDVISVLEDMDQEAVSRTFTRSGLMAIPVVDAEGRMKGIVTVDDIVDVVQEEATEDIQKAGGTEALEAPYFETQLFQMLRKRGVWLLVLFLGEMLTATAMGFFEHEIARAVVLALFIPLIISSGGNSGSQASTLVIRAMALGEVTLRQWSLVLRRELAVGLALGCLLGLVGLGRIVLWESVFHSIGEHYLQVGLSVAVSLVGVVMCGTLCGSMLPFILRRVGFDPASASAPFVATLVDVMGLLIYFTAASIFLGGVLL